MTKASFLTAQVITLLYSLGFVAGAAVNPPSESFTYDFSNASGAAIPAWMDRVEVQGGDIAGNPAHWRVKGSKTNTNDRLLIHLHPEELPADLSLTLVYEDLDNSHFVIQLLDRDGKVLVPDMFSGIVRTSRDTRSDTYVINFIRHPKAATIAIKRVRGPLILYGFTLMNVVCELPSTVDGDRENCLASSLMEDKDFNKDVGDTVKKLIGRSLDWTQKLLLSQQASPEDLSRALLLANTLPDYVPEAEVSGNVTIWATCGEAMGAIVDELPKWHPQLNIDMMVASTPKSVDNFQAGVSRIIAISHPMDLKAREEYFKKWGKAPIDFPFATDYIQVLVHENNPLTHITLTELEAIYAENPPDRTGPITEWSQLKDKTTVKSPITVYGGWPSWGTSKSFASLAMQGKGFHGRIVQDHVVNGIEMAVALDPTGIGYAIRGPQSQNVRVVPVAVSSGRDAYLPNVANIYNGSYPLTRNYFITIGVETVEDLTPAERELLNFILTRQGQEIISKNGMLPLTLEQLVHARKLLKLN